MVSALDDFMGIDGLNSILKFAQLDEFIEKKPSRIDSISLKKFQAFIDSMMTIMGYGTDKILFHYGKYYLALKFVPYMTELSSFIQNFQEWMGGTWIIEKDELNEKIIKIQNSPFSLNYPKKSFTTCHIIRGIFEIVMEQLTGEKYICEEIKCSTSGGQCCEFLIKRVF